MSKRRILIIMGRYLPGYKDGGPVRSIKNLTDYLGDEYDFHIVTTDRDHGDEEPYYNIIPNQWNKVGKANVFYVKPGGFSFTLLKIMANESDLIYICGCFNDYAIKVMILNRLRLIKKTIVVAPMGLFSPKEFRLKYAKKKAFIIVWNWLGLFKTLYWSATSQLEINDVRSQINIPRDRFFVAEDLPRKVTSEKITKVKDVGKLTVAWISRIAPKKNLLGAIEILNHVHAEINFNIYGPIQEEKYWKICKKALINLPKNVKWEYKGVVESEYVVEELKANHIFLFPTLGENYGHVIQEALSAGCPCLLSDQTPWLDVQEAGAGYVFSLDAVDQYADAIENYAQKNTEQWNDIVQKVHNYVEIKSNYKAQAIGYRKIFKLADNTK